MPNIFSIIDIGYKLDPSLFCFGGDGGEYLAVYT